jgi:integrase/recombinase XerC
VAKNWDVNLLEGVPVGPEEPALVSTFLDQHDFAEGTRRLIGLDIRQFARWFTTANGEKFTVGRVTMRDVLDYRDHLRREKAQAVATVNRSLVLLRRFFGWLVEQGHITANPAKGVKQLRKQPLAPKGLDRSQVRRILREVELRQDLRANAVLSLMLYAGARISDVVGLELHDLEINERSGSATFRQGKGNKQRTVPLPLPCRRAVQAYLEVRPPIKSAAVFVGERGPLGERGIRAIVEKYGTICGIDLHPHLLRHTMAHRFLEDNPGDLVSLSQILGHSNINTTALYCQRTQGQLGEASEKLNY